MKLNSSVGLTQQLQSPVRAPFPLVFGVDDKAVRAAGFQQDL